jgi:CRP-like cAMP-binding protein
MDASTSALLSEHALFADLPAAAVDKIAGCARSVCFDAGEIILSEGAAAGTFYLLRTGKVALSTHAPGKGHLLIQTVGPGESLGLSWLFPPYQWQFDARAIEFVETLALDGPCMRAKFEEDPALGYQMLNRITPVILTRLQQTRLRLLDLYSSGPDGHDHDHDHD